MAGNLHEEKLNSATQIALSASNAASNASSAANAAAQAAAQDAQIDKLLTYFK